MRLVSRPLIPDRSSGCRLLAFCLLAALAASGCGHEEKSHNASVSKPPTVRIIQPETGTKKASVTLDEERVELAKKMVEVADADVKAAKAQLEESKAILAKYQAEVERWDTEVKRMTQEVSRGVVDPQILLESTNQWKSSVASRDTAQATITKVEAHLLSKQATFAKATVDVSVARADLAVATSEAKRIEA